ncbi:MAG: YihY/virulence factor BrkB family protein [Deltaproteobacteria bacterium]|nr:YihY/virulence factor BrkB family protein [Deltaproteobacteria bacterium]
MKRLHLTEFWHAIINVAQQIGILAKQTVEAWIHDGAIRMAAALAFYTIFSIGPALLIGLFVAETMVDAASARNELSSILDSFVTPADTRYILSLLETTKVKIAGDGFPALSVITAIIAATGVFTELQSGLNAIWNVRSQRGLSLGRYIEMRFISFLIVLGIGLLLLVSLAATTMLSTVESIVFEAFPIFANHLSKINSLISLAVIPVLVACAYKFIPATKIAWGDIWPGCVLVSLLLAIGKFAITIYLNFARISSLYGAAGSLVILLVWVYFSAQVFFFGAELTKVYASQYGSRKPQTLPSNDSPSETPSNALS